MIIVDTNVLSEPTRPSPSPRVLQWLDACDRSTTFTTAITEAEILLGLALMPEGRRRAELEVQTRNLFVVEFAGRVLPFDSAAARAFPDIVVARKRSGRPIKEADAQIAAIARAQGAAIATRNTVDFESCGIALIDPWAANAS